MFQIQAKVLSRFEKRTGTSSNGNAWESQDYLVEYDYDKQYPTKLILNFFGEERIKEASSLLHKDTIADFSFDVESREIKTKAGNQMWITSARCFRVTLPNAQPAYQQQPAPAPQPAPQQSADPFAQADNDDASDLPF